MLHHRFLLVNTQQCAYVLKFLLCRCLCALFGRLSRRVILTQILRPVSRYFKDLTIDNHFTRPMSGDANIIIRSAVLDYLTCLLKFAVYQWSSKRDTRSAFRTDSSVRVI
jgi:hypothetical protein